MNRNRFPLAWIMTLFSMALTLGVVTQWLSGALPWYLALLVGAALDGAWLITHKYEQRMAEQGDASAAVVAIGWGFGLMAAGILLAHALVVGAPAEVAVCWLPLGAKALWYVHGVWERTEVSAPALREIKRMRQAARDSAALGRAQVRSQTVLEEIRADVLRESGTRLSRAQQRAALGLAGAWAQLETARESEGVARALTSVTGGVPAQRDAGSAPVTPAWNLPRFDSLEQAEQAANVALTDIELDRVLAEIRDGDNPPLTQREAIRAFRARGYSAGQGRLAASWKRISGESEAI